MPTICNFMELLYHTLSIVDVEFFIINGTVAVLRHAIYHFLIG